MPYSAQVTLDAPEEELYQTALALYQDEVYTLAIDVFRSLINNYPNGQYVSFAKIKLIDCYYITKDFQKSAQLAEEFIADNPSSDSAAYAAYIAGRSYQLNYTGLGRDITTLNRARDVFGRLLTDYPESLYAETAKNELTKINQMIADHHAYVQNFYENQQMTEAAEKRVALKSEFLASNPVDLKTKTEIQVKEGVDPSEASKLVLAREAQKITLDDRYTFDATKVFIMNLSCGEGHAILKFANLQYSTLKEKVQGDAIKSEGDNHLLSLNLGADFTQDESFSCGDNFNLKVEPKGQIRIGYNGNIKAIPLDNPVRLLLVLAD